jgi:hypothetical protein
MSELTLTALTARERTVRSLGQEGIKTPAAPIAATGSVAV